MNPSLTWENYIEIKEQEISMLEQEIKSLESHLPKSQPLPPETLFESKSQTEKLQEIFTRYASIFNYNELFLNLTNFKLIFTELNLQTKDLTWKKAELIYYSVSKRTNIDFKKFQKILKKLAFERFKSRDLQKLLPLLKIPEKRLDLIDKNFEKWSDEAKSSKIKEVVSGYEELLRIVFAVYGSKDVKYRNLLGLANLIEFYVEFRVVPDFVSKFEVARVFRAFEFKEFLDYEGFLVVFTIVAMMAMVKVGVSDLSEAVSRFLAFLSEKSEDLYNKNNDSSR
jgi:hypothetical protein